MKSRVYYALKAMRLALEELGWAVMTDACRDWRGALGAAALGGLDPTEEIASARAPRRLRRVPRRAARARRAVARARCRADLARSTPAPAEPSSALGERVLDRLATRARRAPSRRTRRGARRCGAAAVAIAAAIVGVVLLLERRRRPSGTRVFMPGVGAERAASATATLHGESAGTEVDVKVVGPARRRLLLALGHRRRRPPDRGRHVPGQRRPRREFRLMTAVPLSEARRIWVTDDQNEVVLDARLPVST